jgi:hypothetical protein
MLHPSKETSGLKTARFKVHSNRRTFVFRVRSDCALLGAAAGVLDAMFEGD